MNVIDIFSLLNDHEYLTPLEEEFEDTKGVIRIRKLQKDRQHNGQKKKDKGTNNDLQTLRRKLKIEQIEPNLKPGVDSRALEE